MEQSIEYKLFKNDIPEDFYYPGDIAIDTETMGLNIKRDRLCLVQFSNSQNPTIVVQYDGKSYNSPNLKKLFTDESRQKIFHFARFDLAVLEEYLDIKLKNIYCTKVASKLARTYSEYHGLKELCRELLGIHISKHQQSSNWGLENLSKDQLEYACRDVIYLHSLRDCLNDMLSNIGRYEIAKEIYNFLPMRAHLDILGFENIDIFSH